MLVIKLRETGLNNCDWIQDGQTLNRNNHLHNTDAQGYSLFFNTIVWPPLMSRPTEMTPELRHLGQQHQLQCQQNKGSNSRLQVLTARRSHPHHKLGSERISSRWSVSQYNPTQSMTIYNLIDEDTDPMPHSYNI